MSRVPVVAGVLAACLSLAACGESPEDEARDDGERVGQATRALYVAATPEDAQKAADELRAAVNELGADTRERVRDQVDVQSKSLTNAVDAYRRGGTATTSGGVEDARENLREAVQDIAAQADSFRSGNDSVANEFWRGFEDGFDNV